MPRLPHAHSRVRCWITGLLLVLVVLPAEGAEEAPPAPVEEIVVLGTAPQHLALDVERVALDGGSISADNPRSLLSTLPGVDANGQGGDFQTFSIRGISRQRVSTRIAHTPIISDRRAGASISFVDPLLLGTGEVIRGPASTLFGSRALGGAVQLSPARYDGPSALLGYRSEDDRNVQHAGWGSDLWTFGFSRREASDGETPNGTRRFSRFERISMLASTRQTVGDLDVDLLIIPAIGWDIGKPNADFPERTTLYPRERHLVVDGSISMARQWELAFYVHPNDLETEVREAGQRNEVVNEAVDFGLSLGGERRFGDTLRGSAGIGYDARRGVRAREKAWLLDAGGDPLGPPTVQETLADGRRDELGVHAVLRWQPDVFEVEGGARGFWVRQDADGHSDTSDFDGSAFLSGIVFLPHDVELAANVSTGIRQPTLSESFFSGTTGRGLVVGNPGLDSERSFEIDGGLRWRSGRGHVSIVGFRNDIDHYIERVAIAPGVRTFENITSGVIWGVEGEGGVSLPAEMELFVQGHWMRGRENGGGALADVPPPRITAGLRRTAGWVRGELRYQHRFSKDDFASGEREIRGADLLDLELGVRLWRALWLGFGIGNLTDERYLATADDQAVPEPGRSFAISLRWKDGEAL